MLGSQFENRQPKKYKMEIYTENASFTGGQGSYAAVHGNQQYGAVGGGERLGRDDATPTDEMVCHCAQPVLLAPHRARAARYPRQGWH